MGGGRVDGQDAAADAAHITLPALMPAYLFVLLMLSIANFLNMTVWINILFSRNAFKTHIKFLIMYIWGITGKYLLSDTRQYDGCVKRYSSGVCVILLSKDGRIHNLNCI